jgi:hypothetical protein
VDQQYTASNAESKIKSIGERGWMPILNYFILLRIQLVFSNF